MALRDLVPWRPKRDHALAERRRDPDPFFALQSEMNRVFEDFWRGFGGGADLLGRPWERFQPPVDLEETESELRLTAEIPGLEEKDFQIEVQNDQLVLKGEKREERGGQAEGWYERSSGSFHRVFQLPCEVEAEKASARYRNGVLSVTLPKSASARARARRIPVKSS